MTIQQQSHIKYVELTKIHGTPAEQKEKLVDGILSSFQSPDEWPMTDSERIGLLRWLYNKALIIRDTEATKVPTNA